jgi:hypothetical protein
MVASFERCTLDQLEIEDAKSFRHIAVYGDLERILRKSGYSFRVLPEPRWDRALLLNLTYWAPDEAGDVLVDRTIPCDVVAHVTWHHLATTALKPASGPTPISALFLGEAIASAFDLYLVGRILGRAPRSTFLATQVEAMAETADAAGLSEPDFEKLLEGVAEDPEGAFASLRQLLVDATAALVKAERSEDALGVLLGLEGHRFAPLLHRYELSNWVLYARAYGSAAPCAKTDAVERALREAKDPLAWLIENWVAPAT